jgi:hypothetical protein
MKDETKAGIALVLLCIVFAPIGAMIAAVLLIAWLLDI